MSAPNYEKIQDERLPAQNPPPYSEKESHNDPLNFPAGPAPAMAYGTSPPYVPNYGPPGAGPSQGPIMQQPQTVYITHAQPTNEPDYLAYSIFTMLCCCLPLGIAALVYSIQTREANLAGNAASAKRNSKMARTLAHTALGLGLALLILYIILVVFVVMSAH
ncbi:transmembrane protein PMIS2 [Tiliqua scincoides]|uniref:transmembrane protein PMIS2 n=1 Tax=Tiliqua scincoides TaxID=71010 RepID=UPI00346338BC